jgi:addiction module HigA family antidote
MDKTSPPPPANKGGNPLVAGLEPVHPGEILADIVMPGLEVTAVDFAAALGVSRNQLYKLLRGANAVSPEMALRLGKVCGNGAEFWSTLQANFDLAMARQALGPAIDALPTLKAREAA